MSNTRNTTQGRTNIFLCAHNNAHQIISWSRYRWYRTFFFFLSFFLLEVYLWLGSLGVDQRSVVSEPPTQHRQAVIASWWDFYQFEASRLGIPQISSLTAKIGLSLIGPILHTPTNQPSTNSSLVLECSVYYSNPVTTGTAPVVPYFCSTPNEQNHRQSGRSVLILSRSLPKRKKVPVLHM